MHLWQRRDKMTMQPPTRYDPTPLERYGYPLLHRGKVRDTYQLDTDILLQIATDRCSIYDFVLGTEFPIKGHVLAAMTVFWLKRVFFDTPSHLLAFGSGINEFLPEELHSNTDYHARALVVKKLDMLPVECVARGYITGSGFKDYQRTGMVCGHELPKGLHDGSRLDRPIFTPATKATEGHDENISAQQVRDEYGNWPEQKTLHLYKVAYGWARDRGILIADTKFEFGHDGTLADEVITPDSSRLWDPEDYRLACVRGKPPRGFDKQFVRDWGRKVKTPFTRSDGSSITGIHKLDPKNAEHAAFVLGTRVPQKVVDTSIGLYLDICKRIIGQWPDSSQNRRWVSPTRNAS